MTLTIILYGKHGSTKVYYLLKKNSCKKSKFKKYLIKNGTSLTASLPVLV